MTDHAAPTQVDDAADPTAPLLDPSDDSAEPTTADRRDLDEEDYLAPAGRRSRLTTGLLVALIFLVGILVGVLLTKTLSPTPPPPVVYVLNDSGSPASSPSASR